MQLLHVYMTITCSFHDGISLKPLSYSVAPQTPTSLSGQLERLTEAYMAGVLPLAEYKQRRQDLDQ